MAVDGGSRTVISARYTPYYCEENIWWLAQELGGEVVMLANPWGVSQLFQQRAAERPGEPVRWDYHVILSRTIGAMTEVWDLDCLLGAPLPAVEWLAASLPGVEQWSRAHRPWFRVIPASTYLAEFCSDRSHMLDCTGGYQQAPPPWPCIGQGALTLMSWVDLTRPTPGMVLDYRALCRHWGMDGGAAAGEE
jgi:hypothetical protein